MKTMKIVDFAAATEADHEELVRLAKTSKYTKDFSNRVMFSSPVAYARGWIIKAVRDGKIVGFSCVRHKVRQPEVMLYFIVVDPEFRSKGIGEFLIRHTMQSAPSRRMALNVMKDNDRAIAFYRRLGFQEDGEAMDGLALRLTREFR